MPPPKPPAPTEPKKPSRKKPPPPVKDTVKPTPGSTVRTRTRARVRPAPEASVRVPAPGRTVREDEILHTCGDCKATRDDNKFLCVCKKSVARDVLVPKMSPEKLSIEAGVRQPPKPGSGVRGLPSGGKSWILIAGLLAVGLFAYSRMSGSSGAEKAA